MLKNNPNIDYQLKKEELLKERIFLKEGYKKAQTLFNDENPSYINNDNKEDSEEERQ